MVDQNKKEYKNFGFGLKKLPPDKRDVAFGSLFGLPDLSELPRDYFIPALEIKNQFNSDLCTAYAATATAEFQDEVVLSPYYTFAKGKQLSGDIEGWGLDLRTICKAACKHGFLAKEDDPGNLPRDGSQISTQLDDLASYFKKESFLAVKGQYDLFDDIRITIWANREKKQGVITGCLWRNNWTYANEGIIPKFNLY